MTLVYAGIDEAGYGPLLGPLTVASATCVVDSFEPGGKPPNVWRLLRRSTCRAVKGSGGRIPVADSKTLKLPNTSKGRHPLYHLERGVLAALPSDGDTPRTDRALHAALGCDECDEPWYLGGPVDLPVGSTSEEIGIAANVLHRDQGRTGVRVSGMRCVMIPEDRFNETIDREGSKGAVTRDAAARLISDILAGAAKLASASGGEPPAVRVVCDRQGGRTEYHELLSRAAPGSEWVEDARTPAASRYRLATGGPPGVADVAALFTVEAEASHFPVALASMTAKYVRELAMIRFNRFWCARLPELKPTAGYRTDARRWLGDAAPVLSASERRRLIRRA